MLRRTAALLAAFGLLLALAGPAMATETLNPDHVGIGWDAKLGDELVCEGDLEKYEVEEGEVLWHFILTDPASDSGTITATFGSTAEPPEADLVVVQEDGEPFTANSLHFWIVTPEDYYLKGATTDTDGGNLNLSHTCYGGPPPEIPEAPFAFLLPVLALGALGAYMVINRRKGSVVA